jgi:hypothetical protein
MLDALASGAAKRAEGATTAPWGWVHSEFHPTSLHIGKGGWRLLDFARAFTGPGLLDLVSWFGTVDDADPVRLRCYIEAYVAAGGHPTALAERGLRWIKDPAQDETYIDVVRRHLKTAVHLLGP